MVEGSKPVDVVKVFLCGSPGVGKTTIRNTLTKVGDIREFAIDTLYGTVT